MKIEHALLDERMLAGRKCACGKYVASRRREKASSHMPMPSRLLILAAVGAPCALLAQPAAAQVLDQYLPPNIPGYATELGVTVQSRLRPDYEPLGIRAGSVIIRPNMSESLGYNDNALGTTQSHGSMEAETQATLAANTDWNRNGLSAYFNVDDLHYPEQPSQNQTNWIAGVGGFYEFGRDRLELGYTHFNLNQGPTAIDSFSLQLPVTYRVDDVRASYTTQFGRFSVTPNAEFSYYNFDNTVVGGQPFSQQFRNRDMIQGGLTTRYEFSAQRNAVLVVRGYDTRYITPQIGQPKRDNSGFAVLGGIEYLWSGALRFRALVGYEQREYTSSAYKTQTAPVAEASVIWTPTELTTVTGTLSRIIEDAADETVTGYTYTTFRGVVDHELLRNVLLQGHAGVQAADYQQGGGTQTIYNVGVNATWLLNRNLQLRASYDYTNSSSSGTTAATNGPNSGDYNSNIYLLTLGVAL